ncbi:MAG: hypothetical protein L0170_14480, partial [Acidobacteria bacterium]|nr:hypothetical protein [Acidobacteriota bacterium]
GGIGWSDAGNDNGEARAQALFLSGLSHVLRQRRPEIPTEQLRELVDAIEYGMEFMLELREENTEGGTELDLRRAAHKEELDQLCGEKDYSHYANVQPNQDPNGELWTNGHIWEEHHLRPKGRDDGEAGLSPDYNDSTNTGVRVFNCAHGCADAALAMMPFDATLGTTYLEQAQVTREYLFRLNECFVPPDPADKYLVYRAQVALDFLIADLAGDPPPGYTSNLEAARAKLMQDLQALDLGNPSFTYHRDWVGCAHGMTAPQNPPWIGLACALEYQLAEPSLFYVPTWRSALSLLASRWYVGEVLPSAADNPLRMSRYWRKLETHQEFKGDVQRSCDKVAYEAKSTALLASL